MVGARMFAPALAVLLLAGISFAGEECPISTALDKLPQLTYRIGKTDTDCAKSAAKLAKEQDVAIRYVVAKKTFGDEQEAKLALVEATEKFVNDFATPCKCEVSGKTTVAGKELCCEVSAGETAKLVAAAMKTVKMTYLIGEKECNCPIQASELAKNSGKETFFIVVGEKTRCKVTSRLNLARAKYKAAVVALAKADKDTATSKL